MTGDTEPVGPDRASRPADPSGRHNRLTDKAPPPPRRTCPGCHHASSHQPGCELESLSVEDAAVLGYDAARERVRLRESRAEDDLPPRPAFPEVAVPPPPWDGNRPGSAPPPRPACPSCHHTWKHQPGCELEPLSVEDASLLGYEAARKRVRALVRRAEEDLAEEDPAPDPPRAMWRPAVLADREYRAARDSDLARSAPPPRPACPSCHHTWEHLVGCELEPLPVRDASLLGHEAARDRVRLLAADEGSRPPGPRPGVVRGWLRRLLRR